MKCYAAAVKMMEGGVPSSSSGGNGFPIRFSSSFINFIANYDGITKSYHHDYLYRHGKHKHLPLKVVMDDPRWEKNNIKTMMCFETELDCHLWIGLHEEIEQHYKLLSFSHR